MCDFCNFCNLRPYRAVWPPACDANPSQDIVVQVVRNAG